MSERIEGFDVARAVAVFGMVLVNFKVVMNTEDAGPGWLELTTGFFEGKAAATFVVLAGIGVSLLTARTRLDEDANVVQRARARLLKRAAFLFVVGLAYTPIWPGDILHFYGVYLLVAAFTFGLPSRHLWTGFVVANLVFVGLLFSLDYERGWDWTTLAYTDFWTAAGMVRHLFFNGFHPVFPWVAFVFAGMWLGRRDLSDRRMRWKVFWTSLAALVGGTIVSGLFVDLLSGAPGNVPHEDIVALFGTEPLPPNPFYMLVALGAAGVVISGSVTVALRFKDQWWVRALVAAGQMSLSLYVAHVIIGMGVLVLFENLEGHSLAFATTYAVVFTLLGVLCAWVWRMRFSRGPLEAGMRRLTG